MIWTLLILVLAIALYIFGGKFINGDGKKSSGLSIVMHKGINALAIILIAGSVCSITIPIINKKHIVVGCSR